MNDQHLSDEAVAAFADGVLSGHARDRASRHTAGCAECSHAVRIQREAAWRLRAAVAPPLPTGLLDRLRSVPDTTELTGPPTALGPDGKPVLPTTAWPSGGLLGAPMAAFVPHRPAPHQPTGHPVPGPGPRSRGGRTALTATLATLAIAGAVTAGTVAVAHGSAAPGHPTDYRIVHRLEEPAGRGGVVAPVTAFHAVQR